MRFGVNTFIWSSSFTPADFTLLPRIREQGFDGVELPLIHPRQMFAAGIRAALESSELEPTFCMVLPSGLNLISEDSAVRGKTIQHLTDCIRIGADLGGKIVAGPAYAPVGYLPGRRRTADEWNWAVEGFQSLGDALTGNDMELAIEPLNRFETYFLNTVSDTVELCRQIGHPRVGILFDTFHANIEEKDIGSACLAAGAYLKHVHTSENDRGTPGSGHVPWQDVFAALRSLDYDRWLTIESFGFALGDLSAAASIWRDLAPAAEDIAFDGLRFLRRSIATQDAR